MAYPPGPRSLLGLDNVRRFSDDTLKFVSDLHAQFGDSVHFRMGPYRAFFFYHPDQIKEILTLHWKKLPKMKRQVQVLRQWDGDGLVLSEGDLWAKQHRLIQPAFAAKRFGGYVDVMVRRARERVRSWGTSPIDLDGEMTRVTLEIICETLFGAEIGQKTADLGKAVAILGRVAIAEMKMLFIPPVWLPTAHNREKLWAMKLLDNTISHFIEERRKSRADRGDLLSMLLLATDEGEGGMSDKQARDEAMVLFLAGHDTTAAALIWTAYLFTRYPEVQAKARAEVVRMAGESAVTAEDIPKCKYLKQVIQESLRLYPPAIGTFGRQPTVDLEIGGYCVPKNSLVYTFSYVTHRDARWFPDPERFDPDRFAPEREGDIPKFAYFPFGAGPRACIAMNFALTEMTAILATILQKGTLAMENPRDVAPLVGMSLRPAEPIRLTLT